MMIVYVHSSVSFTSLTPNSQFSNSLYQMAHLSSFSVSCPIKTAFVENAKYIVIEFSMSGSRSVRKWMVLCYPGISPVATTAGTAV